MKAFTGSRKRDWKMNLLKSKEEYRYRLEDSIRLYWHPYDSHHFMVGDHKLRERAWDVQIDTLFCIQINLYRTKLIDVSFNFNFLSLLILKVDFKSTVKWVNCILNVIAKGEVLSIEYLQDNYNTTKPINVCEYKFVLTKCQLDSK